MLHKEIQNEECNSLNSHGNQVLSNKVPLKRIGDMLLTYGGGEHQKARLNTAEEKSARQNKRCKHNGLE